MSSLNQLIAASSQTSVGQRTFTILWYLLMLLGLLIFVASFPGYVSILPEGPHVGDLVFSPTNFDIGLHIVNVMASIAAVLLSLTLAWQLFQQKSSDRMVAFVSVYLIIYAIGFSGPLEMFEFAWPSLQINSFEIVSSVIFGPMSIALLTLFPDGQFVPPWSKWLIAASIPLIPMTFFYQDFVASAELNIVFWLFSIYGLILFALAFSSQIFRYRNISSQAERQQIKWVVYGLGLWLLSIVISSAFYIFIETLPPASSLPWWVSVMSLFWTISLALLPLSLAISVMRFRLYDIDIIINRTLVFGILTALVILTYIVAVGMLGSIFQQSENSLIAFASTVLIAVLFNPMRIRLQSGVNRIMFGDRDEPFEVVRRLGRRLETNADPSSILPAIVETVTQTLKIPFAEITLFRGNESYAAASQGKAIGKTVRYPLAYQNETIGYLDVSQRTLGEALAKSDQALLRQIARQAGPAVQAVRLTQELRASRVNIITAREEERRRLRRDLHDGLGPVLASQGLKMAAASQLIRSDPKQAKRLLDDLAVQNESSVSEVRRLVNDLRPAALDAHGLVGAISDYALEFGDLKIIVEVSKNTLPPLPAAIEVACFRIATEALTNVSRHAEASTCKLKIFSDSDDSLLCLEVTDDGIGIPSKRKSGVGFSSMRERAEEIGGNFVVESQPGKGTKIIARLPLVNKQL